MLSSWAQRINLTGDPSAEAIAGSLVLDAAGQLAALPPFASAVDLGSGAGLPGIPWAILAPERQVVLVEARERRHHFQRAAVRELGLKNVELRRGRLEDLPAEPREVVVAQAVAPAAEILPSMPAWAVAGGLVAIPGAAPPDATAAGLGLTDITVLEYRAPMDGAVRTIWTARTPD